MPDPDSTTPAAAKTTRSGRSALVWIARHYAGVLISLLAIVLAVWAFAAVAYEVVSGDTLSFDESCVRALRQTADPAKPIGPEWLPEIGRDLTAVGGVAVLTLLTFSVAGFLGLRRMYGAMSLVLLSALGALLMSTLLKSLFDRPRPNLVPHLSQIYTSSFPSGHSMLSAAIYLTLGTLLGRFVQQRTLKAYFLVLALLFTFLVGISRVYMGVHYPTDVLAGWAAGLSWALICSLVAWSLQQRGVVEKAAQTTAEDATDH